MSDGMTIGVAGAQFQPTTGQIEKDLSTQLNQRLALATDFRAVVDAFAGPLPPDLSLATGDAVASQQPVGAVARMDALVRAFAAPDAQIAADVSRLRAAIG